MTKEKLNNLIRLIYRHCTGIKVLLIISGILIDSLFQEKGYVLIP